MDKTDFGCALTQLKAGAYVTRRGWHLAGMYLGLQNPDEYSANTLPYVYLCIPIGAQSEPGGTITVYDRVPWLASQTDMLAEDWANIIA